MTGEALEVDEGCMTTEGLEVDWGIIEGTEERDDWAWLWLMSLCGMAGNVPRDCGTDAGMLDKFCLADDDPIPIEFFMDSAACWL